jgi:hypothetical protein
MIPKKATYQELKNLKIGDIFKECEYGYCIECRVLTVPKENKMTTENRNQLKWKAQEISTLEEIDYLVTEGLAHYAPKIYLNQPSKEGE